MDDLLTEFLTETNESLDTVDNELVRLEQNPNDKAVLDNIFRLVHTIKGTCGFLGLPRLESVAHAAENVLGNFRDGKLTVNSELVSLILQALDTIKMILRGLEETGAEPEGDDDMLIAMLDEAAEGKLSGPAEAAPAVDPDAARSETEKMLGRALKPGEVSLEELEAAFAAAPGPDDLETPEAATPVQEAPKAAEAKAAPKAAPKAAAKAAPAASDDSAPKTTNQSIRVSVDLLEDLMNLVSELVLTRNQLLQTARRHENSEFTVPLQRLSQCTTELQEGVMKTRMQPVGNAWQKLPRIVRDLSHELGKKIELEMHGAETELDRQVLELIRDPLTHMVRNSADHGVEMPADRVAAGKPETGKIRLNAYHEGGHIIIEIIDDGKGIDASKIAKKVLENGLATEAELDGMSENQIQKFIFHPGLSTAEQVTAVSGRGVGMDVVRSNIEKIGGTVELDSKLGEGTRFAIKIPLTLAIVSSLIVGAGGERFAVPQISVLELVRVVNGGDHVIEHINSTPVLRLRNRLLPLVRLDKVLGLETATEAANDNDQCFVVVAQVGAFTFGIVVDEVFDTEEIVVKPMAPILKSLSVYSGTTILGDGSVIMILDPNGIARATAAVQDSEANDTLEMKGRADNSELESMLVFRAGSGNPKAVPLSLIARLEEIDVSTIEYTHGRPMVQYRGNLMPLLTVDPHLQLQTEGHQAVLVFSDEGHVMGLAVDEILDIVETELKVELTADVQNGRLGTAVVGGKITEIMDVGHYLKQAFKDHIRTKANEGAGGSRRKPPRVLLVDDSAFFRNMLKPLLRAGGYEVTCASSAEEALALRDKGEAFDLIVSDIEMPGLSGFEFAEEVRQQGRWAEVPMVALSALASPADFERGREAGFNDYVAKYDRDSLLTVLEEQLDFASDVAA